MMMTMQDSHGERCKHLALTQDEAMALLELCVMTPQEHDTLTEHICVKVSALCREFLRSECVPGTVPAMEACSRLRAA
jgi:hypothetical protein